LSSSTIDYMNLKKSKNTYTVAADLFAIRGANLDISINAPVYEPCALPDQKEFFIGERLNEWITQYKIDAAYKVFTSDGGKVHWKIFTSSACPGLLWLGDYVDNTANGAEIVVQSVDKLVMRIDDPIR
jgi:hypothetical protein